MNKENTFFEDYQKLINSFEALKKDKENPFFKSKYVALNQILPIVKKHCTENNFVLAQYPEYGAENDILVTELIHESGKSFKGGIKIVSKDSNDPQKIGASITYMRRYSLVTMLGLEEEDDDGNTASTPPKKPTMTEEQFKFAIKYLVDKKIIKIGTSQDIVMKHLESQHEVPPKFMFLIEEEIAKASL